MNVFSKSVSIIFRLEEYKKRESLKKTSSGPGLNITNNRSKVN